MYYNNLFKNESHATDINHVIIRTGRDNDEIVISSSDPCLFFPSLHLLEEVLIRDWQAIYILSLYSHDSGVISVVKEPESLYLFLSVPANDF